MSDLRDRLAAVRDGILPRDDEGTLEDLRRRRRSRERRRKTAATAVALLVAVGSMSFVVRSFQGSGAALSGSTYSGPVTVVPDMGRTIQVGPHGQTTDMVAGFGKLWVSAYGVDGGSGVDKTALIEVDPQTMTVERTLPVPNIATWETGGGGLLATDDALWIAAGTPGEKTAALFRVDPSTGATQTFTWPDARGFGGIASDGTDLWLLGQQGDHPIVTRFDPGSGTFSGDVLLSGDAGRHIAAVPGEVVVSELTWADHTGPCLSLASIDTSTTPTLRAEFPADPCSEQNQVGMASLIVLDGRIWNLWAPTETFTRVDPATAMPLAVESPNYEPVSPRSNPVVSDTGVWFGDYPGGNGGKPDILTRFDPVTDSVQPSDMRIGWSVSVAAYGELFAMGWDGTLTEIRLTTPRETDPLASIRPTETVSPSTVSGPLETDAPALQAAPIDCPSALERTSRLPIDQTAAAMGGHLPSSFPQTDFGLASAWSVTDGPAPSTWATWTDQECRTVTVYYFPDGGGPVTWKVQYDKQKACGNSVMGMGECIGYHVGLSTSGSLSVQTIGLSREEADNLVQSIPT